MIVNTYMYILVVRLGESKTGSVSVPTRWDRLTYDRRVSNVVCHVT